MTNPSDLKVLTDADLLGVSKELRSYLMEVILEHGGHFSANLGVVELTVALHAVFNTPNDILIWDVGHQAYGHKVLTGRKDELKTIRRSGGISGFPKMSESEYDAFGTGHSSTSISALLGYAESARFRKLNRHHIAVIGDGSLTAGQAFEALNNAGVSEANILIIVNDNNIGIDPNQGALNRHLLDLNAGIADDNLFRSLGLPYYGPFDGHDLPELLKVFRSQKSLSGPRVVHVRTVKGKGYEPAERDQIKWHATASYVKLDAGLNLKGTGVKFQDVFGKTLLELADNYDDVIGITPAMPTGCSMNQMMEKYPERVFDVGIAEQHAVTFSAGLAADGMRPFCNIYSTFLQRAYDQVIHDVCLQNLPVIFCIDRAGVVGEDGPTHHGLYDLAFLKCIPNLIIAAPKDELELRQMMFTAYGHKEGPMAIRYPRGTGVNKQWEQPFQAMTIGKAEVIQSGNQIALIGLGTAVNTLIETAEMLREKDLQCTVINALFLAPLDSTLIEETLSNHSHVYILEDGALNGGFGESVAAIKSSLNLSTHLEILGFPNEIIEQGSREELMHQYRLDAVSIVERILTRFQADSIS
jgi:1-deoxy-D-xylulose-5-phosphate synthase